MPPGRIRSAWILAAAATLLASPAGAHPRGDGSLDTKLYGALLDRHTHAVADRALVLVDYPGLAADPQWQRVKRSLAESHPLALATRNERLALWINAYNILAMDLVARHHPVESIRDIGSWLRPVWKHPAGSVGGRERTLEEIEHRILRPMGDARIHAAIVCASLSCPPLRRDPYEAERLDQQLDEAMRVWLADPEKGARYDEEAHELHLSRVFDWFREDFEKEGSLLDAVRPYLPEALREALARRPEPPTVRFLDYDWSLNDWRREPA